MAHGIQNEKFGYTTSLDRKWSHFVPRVEVLLGIVTLDGVLDDDGYSMDSAYDAWKSGASAEAYAATCRAHARFRPGYRFPKHFGN